MAKRTPEEVCIEYAGAVAAVRAQTRILRDNRCPDESAGERDEASGYMHGAQESCLQRHWNIETGPPPNYTERPELAYDELCDACKVRLRAH
jgi:hypothetical protein